MKKNVIQIYRGITTNVNEGVKSIMYVKKNNVWNAVTCSCKNETYLASVMDNSAIMCDENIDTEETKTIRKNVTCNFYILLVFLSITIALLIAVRIYCYLIKYQAKKHLVAFHKTNNELREVLY